MSKNAGKAVIEASKYDEFLAKELKRIKKN
jgi:hypothetical protein